MRGIIGKKLDLKTALELARRDPAVRHMHFIEKFSMQSQGGKRPRETEGDSQPTSFKAARQLAHEKAKNAALAKKLKDKGAKGGAKGAKGAGGKDRPKGGGKNRAKGSDNTSQAGRKTFDNVLLPAGMSLMNKHNGKPICYKFGRGACSRSDCALLHACQLCGEGHAWKKCALLD